MIPGFCEALLLSVLGFALTAPKATTALGGGLPRTFGKGIPNHPFTTEEVELYNHTLSAGATSGMITHFWSTACGAGVSFQAGLDSGVAIYRYYIDGETEASIVFTPRDVAGVIFDPIGECDGPTCTHPVPGASPAPGPNPSAAARRDEYIIGDRGATCDEACAADRRKCNPVVNPPGTDPSDLGGMMADLVKYDTGARCAVDDKAWWAPDQPSYVWAKNNTNFNRCLGTKETPANVLCNGSHPLVRRLCRCSPHEPHGAWPEKAAMLDLGAAAPSEGDLDLVSAKVPWGTEWIGKTSDMDGYYTNMRVPFYKSIRVTAQLPEGHKPFSVYTIVRGQENVPLSIGGYDLSEHKPRLTQHTTKNIVVPSLGFTPIVNKTSGSGVIWAHTLGIEGNSRFTYLEGCFHLLTPYVAGNTAADYKDVPDRRNEEGAWRSTALSMGLSANFPGVTLSTGMEDYYDSSFYFHAGIFQLPVSGVTHMCSGDGKPDPPHPACPPAAVATGNDEGGNLTYPATSRWAGYRFHEKDPLWFEDGVQLLVRNGDVGGPVPYGSAKCYNLNMNGGPGTSTVNSVAWVYEFSM